MDSVSQTSREYDTGLLVKNCDPRGQFPRFTKPVPLGLFSVGSDRYFKDNIEELRYFKMPPNNRFPLDLNIGANIAIKRTEATYHEHIDNFLHYINDHIEEFCQLQNESILPKLEASFVCYRGVIRRIMTTPYENQNDWCIHVTHFNGTFYLSNRPTEQSMMKYFQQGERSKAMCAWGYKFEQYCSTGAPHLEADTSQPVDECSELLCAFKIVVDGLNILIAAEMDGVCSDHQVKNTPADLEKLKFIELKLRPGDLTPKQTHVFKRYKTLDWWCQCFLVGISNIFVGYRTNNGLVNYIENMEVRSLPKQGKDHWAPACCVTFLSQFLNRIKTLMSDVNDPDTVFEFYFDYHTSRITYKRINGKSEYSFIPDWYVETLSRPLSHKPKKRTVPDQSSSTSRNCSLSTKSKQLKYSSI